ncbi:Katanin p80 WD40 repeat-containing subunit B1-like [Oopsacas minuta]|uniref:Katanin p80 WD40 repeat-containing subunit B1-like n=1 Tax=Oopsacas minuta TaxID=111878 RepID=A0AAV7KC44_9METZ|nr:Katanin p80 WD40 repeat-containing subunit B1-like [Oopsacas minuta]
MNVNGKLSQKAKCTSDYELLCAVFSPSGDLMCGGCLDGNLEVYTPLDGKLQKKCNDNPPEKSFPISCIRFRPKLNHVLVSHSSGEVKLWDISANVCINSTKENRQGMTNSWSEDANCFVTTGVDKNVNIYDAKSCQIGCSVVHTGVKGNEICGDQPRVFSAKFLPGDSTALITAGWDGTIKFWDLRSPGNFIREITGPVIASDALDVEPTSKYILTGSFRKSRACQVHAWEDGKELATLGDGMMSQGYSVCWVGPSMVMFGGGYRNLMKVIKTADNEVVGEVLEVPEVVYSVDYTAAGGNLVSMVTGKDIYVYQLAL